MKSRLVRIGNSRGVRLPKLLIEEAGLHEHALVITSHGQPRAGWAEAARQMRERGQDRLLDGPTNARFDDEEWGRAEKTARRSWGKNEGRRRRR